MSPETILIFGNEGKTLKLLNHLLIAAFGAGFSSLYSVDILAEANTKYNCLRFVGIASTGLVCVQWSRAACD